MILKMTRRWRSKQWNRTFRSFHLFIYFSWKDHSTAKKYCVNTMKDLWKKLMQYRQLAFQFFLMGIDGLIYLFWVCFIIFTKKFFYLFYYKNVSTFKLLRFYKRLKDFRKLFMQLLVCIFTDWHDRYTGQVFL